MTFTGIPLEMRPPGELVESDVLDAIAGRKRYRSSPKLSDGERLTLGRLVRKHRRSVEQLDRLLREGNRFLFLKERNLFLRSFSTRVCASVRALAKRDDPFAWNEIESFAHRLNVSEVINEEVLLRAIPKARGEIRPLALYGPRRMAQQFIVRDLLFAARVDSAFDYSRANGGGEHQLLNDVCHWIDAGDRYWVSADIVNCFPSIKLGHLRGWMPIPEKLLRNVVFLPNDAKLKVTSRAWKAARNAVITGGKVPTVFRIIAEVRAAKEKVRRGLPMGSVLSPLVARAFIGRTLRAVPEAEEVFWGSFSDNLELGANDKPELLSATDAIRKRFATHPAGPISLKVDKIRDVMSGPAYVLGYKVTTGDGFGGRETHCATKLEAIQKAPSKGSA